MQGGLALRIIGDVANQRSDLDLLADRNLQVDLLLPVKVEQDRVAEGADRGCAMVLQVRLRQINSVARKLSSERYGAFLRLEAWTRQRTP
jgi:hypothetical protein